MVKEPRGEERREPREDTPEGSRGLRVTSGVRAGYQDGNDLILRFQDGDDYFLRSR